MANAAYQWGHIVPESAYYSNLRGFLNNLGFTEDVLNSRSIFSPEHIGQIARDYLTSTPTSGEFQMGNAVEFPTSLAAAQAGLYPYSEAALHEGWTARHSTFNAAGRSRKPIR